MAKKKKNPEQEALELEQAYVELTGYNIKKKKRKTGGLIAAICVLAVILAGCVMAIPYLLEQEQQATQPTGTGTKLMAPGTSAIGVDLSGMTLEDATAALEAVYENDMTVMLNGEAYPISSADAVKSFDAAGAAVVLLDDPRLFDLNDWLVLDTEAVRSIADAYAVMFQRETVETVVQVRGEIPTLEPVETEPECQTLVITKGRPATSLDSEVLYQAIIRGYKSGILNVEAAVAVGSIEEMDLQTVYDQHFIAPVDAVMDMETFEVSGGTYGYGFDLSAAQSALEAAAYGEVIEIPFYRTAPEVFAESLRSVLFRDVLSSCSTEHTWEYNRNVNLELACAAMNGTVLFPGEEFSYNETLGERTTEKGYLPAGSYVVGATIETVGGGICQPSSTLYYCCLLADLEITVRDCHMYAVSYLPLGIDATISWGAYDFCFRNNTNYPIRIEAWMSDGYVHVQLIGTDEKDYYVVMENFVDSVDDYETVYEEMYADNPDGYKDGDQITSPYTGYTVYTYRCKYDKATDELISRDYEAYSEYWARDEVIAKIVEKPTEAPVTEPAETEPTPTA